MITRLLTALAVMSLAAPALAQSIAYNQNVTPDVIFGDGNANGHFAVSTNIAAPGAPAEIGLRAKVRFNASGQPENTFNELDAGEYYFDAGVGTGQAFPTPTWAFEWTVNTDVTAGGNYRLGDFTYELGLDYDPGPGTNYVVFDPITPSAQFPWFDHAMGDNSTANGDGVTASSEAEYLTFLNQYIVAQQSWRYSWFDAFNTFDPNVTGVYDIYFKMFSGVTEIAHTQIQVHVSSGEPVSDEDSSWSAVKALFR